jgi:hypothetical protein
MRKPQREDEMQCSFCHKTQDVVGKMISSPSDYPRAYICDECIAVCNSILEDDGVVQPPRHSDRPSHCLMCHPMAPALLLTVEQWVLAEAKGGSGARRRLAELRDMARAMIGLDPAAEPKS